jgi:hypothetical protein
MLDLPPDLEARPIGGAGLFDGVHQDLALMFRWPGLGDLNFAEDVEFHGKSPLMFVIFGASGAWKL